MYVKEIGITKEDLETVKGARRVVFDKWFAEQDPWQKSHFSVLLRRLDILLRKGDE